MREGISLTGFIPYLSAPSQVIRLRDNRAQILQAPMYGAEVQQILLTTTKFLWWEARIRPM